MIGLEHIYLSLACLASMESSFYLNDQKVLLLQKYKKFIMIDEWLARLHEGKCLPEKDLRELCERTKEILMEESNV